MKSVCFEQFPQLSYSGAEAMNALCTNLSFCGENVKKIMVTSSHASEGKSVLSMNIMRTFAKYGKRVALVDADLRRSLINKTFQAKFEGSGEGSGLAHRLAGMAEEEEVIYATDIPGAWFVPVGRDVSNPLPLLNSPHFGELLDHLAQQVDYVIVDAPPLGTVIDAAEIAKSCDGVLTVVAYNTVRKQELIDLKTQLEQTGCPILGCVLNRVEFENYLGRKYYYKSYYKSYYSRDGYYGKRREKGSKAAGK